MEQWLELSNIDNSKWMGLCTNCIEYQIIDKRIDNIKKDLLKHVILNHQSSESIECTITKHWNDNIYEQYIVHSFSDFKFIQTANHLFINKNII